MQLCRRAARPQQRPTVIRSRAAVPQFDIAHRGTLRTHPEASWVPIGERHKRVTRRISATRQRLAIYTSKPDARSVLIGGPSKDDEHFDTIYVSTPGTDPIRPCSPAKSGGSFQILGDAQLRRGPCFTRTYSDIGWQQGVRRLHGRCNLPWRLTPASALRYESSTPQRRSQTDTGTLGAGHAGVRQRLKFRRTSVLSVLLILATGDVFLPSGCSQLHLMVSRRARTERQPRH